MEMAQPKLKCLFDGIVKKFIYGDNKIIMTGVSHEKNDSEKIIDPLYTKT